MPELLAPAAAASSAAEAPPAVLAAGVDAGRLSGVIAPLADARAGPEGTRPAARRQCHPTAGSFGRMPRRPDTMGIVGCRGGVQGQPVV